jgi:tRNA-(ms[2]io[6]A)-hydroxylase
MEARGLTLTKDSGDPYAQALQKLVRTPSAERRVDRLLVAAVIEARSCERLSLLAEGLTDPALARFYGELAQSEDGHQSLFFRLAVTAANGDEATVRERLEWMLEHEARVITDVGLRAAIH